MPLDSRFKLDLVVGEWELYVLDSKVRNPPTVIRNAQTGISVYFDGVKNNRTKALKQLRRQVCVQTSPAFARALFKKFSPKRPTNVIQRVLYEARRITPTIEVVRFNAVGSPVFFDSNGLPVPLRRFRSWPDLLKKAVKRAKKVAAVQGFPCSFSLSH